MLCFNEKEKWAAFYHERNLIGLSYIKHDAKDTCKMFNMKRKLKSERQKISKAEFERCY